ncbi:MAG: MCE family protein [Candidatus Omnitrophica bacterium]|nr:MCE family protein [Candidatus Omnitrophota bacterium]
MEKKELIVKFMAGLFLIVGLGMIVVVIFTMGKNKGFTQPKFKAEVLFRDVGGLIEGAPVQLAGVNVGTVSAINFLEKEFQGRRVKVQLSIFNKFKRQLEQKVRFTIKTEGILGEKLVEIYVGEGGEEVDLAHPIIGEDPLNVQDIAEAFANAAASLTRTTEVVNEADVQELSKVLAETAQSLSETAKGVDTVLTELYYISIKSKRLLDRLEQKVIDGKLFKVF